MNLLKTRRLPAFLLSLCLLCGCGANAISEKKAKTLAFDSVNVQEESVVSMKVESSNLDGEDTYVIIFQTADKNYQIILSKQTGEILRSSYQSIDSVTALLYWLRYRLNDFTPILQPSIIKSAAVLSVVSIAIFIFVLILLIPFAIGLGSFPSS